MKQLTAIATLMDCYNLWYSPVFHSLFSRLGGEVACGNDMP